MNNLVSKNPILRFKLGRKIIKAEGGTQTYYEVTEKPKITVTKGGRESISSYNRKIHNGKWTWGLYDGEGNFIPITKQVTFDDGTILNVNGSKSSIGARNAVKNAKVIERGYIDSNGNKTLLGTPTNNVDKKTKINKTPVNKTEYDDLLYAGKMGGWNKSIGLGNIKDLESLDIIKQLGWEGKSAEEVLKLLNSNDIGGNRVVVDNKWGNQSKAALQNYYNRWLEELKPVEQKPTIQLPQTPVMLRQTISDYSNYASNLKSALGNNNNFSGLSNLVWKKYADDDNSFAANFSRDMRSRFNNYKTLQDWLSNQLAIENALNISGRYRGSRAGDYGDISRSMANWAGGYNYNIDKQNLNALNNYNALIDKYKRTVGGYKQGGQLISRNPIERFKLTLQNNINKN